MLPSKMRGPAFALLATTVGSLAATVSIDLPITNAEVNPDGFPRTAILTGGQFAGFPIIANKGDTLKINVVNELTDNSMLRSTSIHWHGFWMAGTNQMDGGAFVNQCPIAPANSFVYEFQTTVQAGTMWYHSHLSSQYCDGLRGPIVIYDPEDPHRSLYDVDDLSTIITLADWYHTKAMVTPLPASPDSTLINGRGRHSSDPTSEMSVVSVTPGKRYRFRVVSMSCGPHFTFSIHNHTLTVIEADTENVEPVKVDELTVFAGQRYSVVLNADQPIGNYWIRAKPSVAVDSTFGAINQHSAVLRYDGADVSEPTTPTVPAVAALLETSLHPLTNPAAPGTPEIGGVDYALNLRLGFAAGLFTVNGVSFHPPTVPVLLQIMSGARLATELLPAGSVYTLPRNSVIELTIPTAGAPGAPHPFHLHGHAFHVIRSAGSSVYNYDNPVRRDVVSAGTGDDNVTIRFVTDNPGPWFLHCHIDWHLETGLSIIFAEDVDNVASANVVDSAWENLCPLYNALTADQL